ncbi:MAG TPA: MFS transporter [Caulobacterales bacterium]|nr:MFS transporter [Caulobacterales bacterium]
MIAALKGWTSTQRHVVAASYLGWTLDAFDFWLLTYLAKDVAEEFHTDAKGIGVALFMTLFLRPLGAFVFGRLADRFGRRPLLQIDVLLYSALAFGSAFAPDLTTFLLLRAAFGFAMGGEWGLGASLTFEHIDPKARGLVSGLLQTGYPMGGLIAAALTGWLLPEHGWRICMMLSAFPALLVLYIRAKVPESPSWQAAAPKKDNTLSVVARHWGVALFAIFLMAGFNSLSHGTQDFYQNFLRIQMGFDPRLASSIAIFGALGAIAGGLTFGLLSERIGRRRAITAAVLLFLPAVPMWVFLAHAPVTLAIGVLVLQFMVQGAWGVVPAHLNELSPGEARATFPGFVYQFGNLLAAGVGYLQGWMVEDLHWPYSYALASVGAAAAIYIALLVNLGPEAKGASMGVAAAPE